MLFVSFVNFKIRSLREEISDWWIEKLNAPFYFLSEEYVHLVLQMRLVLHEFIFDVHLKLQTGCLLLQILHLLLQYVRLVLQYFRDKKRSRSGYMF